MGNLTSRFLLMIFNSFLVYIVLLNYVGWSGAYIDVLGQSSTADWEHTYFGFTSIQMMLADLNNSFKNSGSFSLNSFYEALLDLLNTITFGLPRLLAWMQGGNLNTWDVVSIILNLFFQPIYLLIYSTEVIAIALWYIILLVGVLLKAASGTYNVPIVNPLDWSDVQSDYNGVITLGQWHSCMATPFLPLGVQGVTATFGLL